MDQAGEGGPSQGFEVARTAPLPGGDGMADVNDSGVEEGSVHRQAPQGAGDGVEVGVLAARCFQGKAFTQGPGPDGGVGTLRASADEAGQCGAAPRGEPPVGGQAAAPTGHVGGVGEPWRGGGCEDGVGKVGQRLGVGAASGGRDGAQDGVGGAPAVPSELVGVAKRRGAGAGSVAVGRGGKRVEDVVAT
ncbi:hypothetical protein ADK55_12305, partial [Streptomyces sp. WM4235]